MTYRSTSKRQKLRSQLGVAARERIRLENSEPLPPALDDDHITIEINRKLTGERAVFELFAGDRCDNYRVYCNDKYLGVMGMTKVSEGIRKALPAVRR